MYVTCEVDVDVDDILDGLTDAELTEHGLMRIKAADQIVGFRAHTVWTDIQQAMRQRDTRHLENLLSTLAWQQAGVILPTGMPVIH